MADRSRAQPVAGVLGGMGPAATVEFMRRVIAATPAEDDADHFRMLVDNNPKVPSRIDALIERGGADPGPVLAGMARGLEAAGADFLAIPCNTAHVYLPAIGAAVSIPVLDMIGLALDRLKAIRPRIRTVGILASPGLRLSGLLDERCEDAGIAVRYPPGDGESELLEVIRAVKAKRLDEGADWAYRDCALRLAETGVDALLVGCTELSVLGGLEKFETAVLDTLDALVSETVARSTGFRA